MAVETSVWINKIEKGISGGSINDDLNQINKEIAGRDPETANRLLGELFSDLNKKGMLPALARSYANTNFTDLDLNGDGFLSRAELDKIVNTKLLAAGTNPVEKSVLRYLRQNVDPISKAHNDEWGSETRISRQDLTAYEQKFRVEHAKAIAGAKISDRFGDAAKFNDLLQPDRKGLVSEQQLKTILAGRGKHGELSASDRELVQFMLDNRKEIAKMNNDQWGWESKISLKDIQLFVQKYKTTELPASIVQTRDFSAEPRKPLVSDNKQLPDLILEFGKENFSALDSDSNGFITRGELRKILQTTRWSRTLGPGETFVMKEMDAKLENIMFSNRDEKLWYKDTKGISQKDLEAYARDQERNRGLDIPKTPGDHNLEHTVNGIRRKYVVHVPPDFKPDQPTAVVYSFHYFTGNPKVNEEYTSINKHADQGLIDANGKKVQVIVVSPQAEGLIGDKLRKWRLNNSPSYRIDEMAFLGGLMDKIEQSFKVDKSREYIIGYSNGAAFAQEAAKKFAHRIAAFVAVAGWQNGNEPEASEAVPALLINGTADKLVPYKGRRYTPFMGRMLPSERSCEDWQRTNQTDKKESKEIYPGVIRDTYTSSKTGKPVVMVTMVGNGHGWPGHPESIDANPCLKFDGATMVFDFLSKHKRK